MGAGSASAETEKFGLEIPPLAFQATSSFRGGKTIPRKEQINAYTQRNRL